MTLKTLGSLLAASALLVLSGCYFPSAVAVTPSVGISVGTFDPYLDPYGSWVTLPGYGRTWQPSPAYVGADFYPYGTGGQWLYTDAGWVFESDYPFGWAVFHYGRWMNDSNYGWLWIPGTEWAPSWVSWRVGGPYVGWAPLGPYGPLAFGYSSWCFVPTASFTVRNVRAYTTGYYDFHHAVGVTAPVRQARVGPPPRYVGYATGTNITPVPVGSVGSAGRAPPPPPPRASSLSGAVPVRPPPPPVGWRTQPGTPPPPASGGFVPPPPASTYRAPPPSTFTSPRSYQPPPSTPSPAPMQAPTRVQPSAPRSPPPPAAMSAPPPAYRAAPPPPAMSMPAPAPPASYRSAPAPAPAPHISAPPPPSAPRSPPPPPPHR